MATYSSFFSSGLLAPPVTIYSRKDLPMHGFDEEDMPVDASSRLAGLSPAVPSSPMAIPDDSDSETGLKVPSNRVAMLTREPRSRTFSSFSGNETMLSSCELSSGDTETLEANAASRSMSPSQPQNGRRRRRSSLAGAASPFNGIKSPSRSIGHAIELQKHLLGSNVKARSNSVSLAAVATDMMSSGNHGVEQNTSLARLRSGSIVNGFKRRALRRVCMVPPAPPPTAPLPELPVSLMDTPICSFLTPKTAPAPAINNAALMQSTVTCSNDSSHTTCSRESLPAPDQHAMDG